MQRKAKPSVSQGPKARSCYICGRQYMLHSFAIHEAQCREMFEKWESQKPPRERRKCPEDPMRGFNPNMSMKELDNLNALSQQTWSEQALVRCENCNRTFLPEKLPIHQRSCTAARPARRVESSVGSSKGAGNGYETEEPIGRSSGRQNDYNEAYEESFNANSGNMVQCRNCGRKFNATSYAKHGKVCAKVFSQSRKVFNSAKQRMQGTDMEEFNRHQGKKSSSLASTRRAPGADGSSSTSRAAGGAGGQNIPKWKLDSMKFRAAMKAAREVSKAEQKSKETGIPLHLLLPKNGPSSGGGGGGGYGGGFGGGGYGEDDAGDGLRCPTCGRTFSQQAGERHIPQCKNIINKPSRLLRGSGAPAYASPESHKGSVKGTFGGGARASDAFAGFSGGETGVARATARRVVEEFADMRGGGGGGYGASGAVVRAGAAANARSTGNASGGANRANSAGASRTVPSLGRTAPPPHPSASARASQALSAGVYGAGGGAQGARMSMASTAMVGSNSARPSPRVSESLSGRASGGFGGGSSGIDGRRGSASGGGAGFGGSAASGAYRIAQSNATSGNNPLARSTALW